MPYKNSEKQKEYQREWARQSPTRNAGREKRREFVREGKRKPCSDCGIQYPPHVMQYDHVRGKKEIKLALAVASVGMEKIKQEIAKCEVVCANCHAERTWNRLQRETESWDTSA